jgi:hypothetical protein
MKNEAAFEMATSQVRFGRGVTEMRTPPASSRFRPSGFILSVFA